MGKGKKSVWKAWQAAPFITTVFKDLFENPFQKIDINSSIFEKLQRIVVLLYSDSSSLTDINEARMDIFCHRRMLFFCSAWEQFINVESFQRLMIPIQIFHHHLILDMNSLTGHGSRNGLVLLNCTYSGKCSSCTCGTNNLPCTPHCKCPCKQNCTDKSPVQFTTNRISILKFIYSIWKNNNYDLLTRVPKLCNH